MFDRILLKMYLLKYSICLIQFIENVCLNNMVCSRVLYE